jgi:hypothetical protein
MEVNEPTPAIKDEDAQHVVASAWRPTLFQIALAFVEGDYSLRRGVPSVAPVGASTARQIASYISDYGETLVELPEEAWTTSVSQWMGIHWDVLVDLWTAESGRSDMVLSVRVFETGDGFHIEVDSVHVP